MIIIKIVYLLFACDIDKRVFNILAGLWTTGWWAWSSATRSCTRSTTQVCVYIFVNLSAMSNRQSFWQSGRMYDKHGNRHQWWTAETMDTFSKKAECFVDQYNNYNMTLLGNLVKVWFSENSIRQIITTRHVFFVWKQTRHNPLVKHVCTTNEE